MNINFDTNFAFAVYNTLYEHIKSVNLYATSHLSKKWQFLTYHYFYTNKRLELFFIKQ